MSKVRWGKFQGTISDAEHERIAKTELYKIGDTILVWVNEGDILCEGQNMDELEPDWHGIARMLAPLYLKNGVAIAQACDELLDKSGTLLGYVRDEAQCLKLVR